MLGAIEQELNGTFGRDYSEETSISKGARFED
jgi:hypothetical protein